MKVELLHNGAITERLSGYWRVKIADEISSTQNELKIGNLINWDLLATEFQSAGRGRLNRTFEAKKSTALLFSFYIEPLRKNEDWGFIPLLAGAAVATTINNLTKSEIYKCKWPNDVFAGNKKIAGILSETFSKGVIIGIGINVTMSETDLPIPTASSIFLQSRVILDRNYLLAEFCNEFKNLFEDWDRGTDFTNYYSAISTTLNKTVKVIQSNSEITGIAEKVSNSGALILKSGEEITVGDVIHLKE